jgi:hypothetical protein
MARIFLRIPEEKPVMAIVDTTVKALSHRLPKVISPKTHAIIDYATAGSFLLMGALLWKRHKRAAIASIACGAMEANTAMMTDYPGGVAKVISFETHGKIDAGFAGMVGMLPTLLGFSDEKESWFFRGQAMGLAAVTGMTDFEYYEQDARRARRRARRAA